MARIPETAVKWINDKLKTKPIKSNYVGATCKVSELDTDIKQCPYCHKMFLNPSFAVKHTLKRHSDQLLLLHKKAMDTNKTEVENSQSVLVNYLKSEFSNLKIELEMVKKVVTHHSSAGNCYKVGVQECKGAGDCPDMNIVGSFGEKSLGTWPEDIVCRDDLIKLQAKVEDVFQMYKEVLLTKEDKKVDLNEGRLYKHLKKELLSEFERMLTCLQRNNSYDEHLSRLTKDLQRLEEVVEHNFKMVKSPETLNEIDRKIEQQIENFYANYGLIDGKHKLSVKSNKRVLSDNSSNVHRLNRRKKNIHTTSNLQGLGFQTRQNNTNLKSSDLHLSADSSTTSRTSILKDNIENNQMIGINKTKVIFEEKLRGLNISPKAKQMSTEEYERKMHLLVAQKELLSQKYSNFLQIYKKVDSQANKLVKSKLKMHKQIRFSESSASRFTSNSNLLVESSSPIGQMKDNNIKPQLELVYDFRAAGDCCEENIDFDYNTNAISFVNSNCASGRSSEKFEEMGFVKNLKPSSKNVPLSNVLVEDKPIDIPDKSLSTIQLVEEFSELSSLDSE